MKKDEYHRLEPFLLRKGARQRLILFLMACGKSVPDLVNFTVSDLNATDLPDELSLYRDEVLDMLGDSKANAPVFVYPSGKPMMHTDFYNIIRRATGAIFDRPLSTQEFHTYIKRGTL